MPGTLRSLGRLQTRPRSADVDSIRPTTIAPKTPHPRPARDQSLTRLGKNAFVLRKCSGLDVRSYCPCHRLGRIQWQVSWSAVRKSIATRV